MNFKGGGTVLTDQGFVELPDYIEVLSKKKLKVKVNAGWEGTHIIIVTPEDVKGMAKHLGGGIMTRSCIMFNGLAFEWRSARNFMDEMWSWFQLLKENGYEKD